jgi:hypothetical protein
MRHEAKFLIALYEGMEAGGLSEDLLLLVFR